jgi:hypothetical protein
MAEKLASGKGVMGRLTKAFVGGDQYAQIQGAVQQAGDAQAAAIAQQQGLPTTRARVGGITATGALVNYNPVVRLELTIEGGSPEPFVLETLVPQIQIPRVGDVVLLSPHPSDAGRFIYAGLAL